MLDPNFLDAIKQLEGFSAKSRWDYAQNTNGYGTKALYAGEVIDKAEADRRFSNEIKKAADFVDKFAPSLDDGSKAALTSLTYNAGTSWTQSGLGAAVANGDIDKARSIFLQYNKAGGAVLDGLVQRRLQEVAWFGGGSGGGDSASAPVEASVSAPQPAFRDLAATLPASSEAPVSVQAKAAAPIGNLDSQTVLLELILKLKNTVPSSNVGETQALAANTATT